MYIVYYTILYMPLYRPPLPLVAEGHGGPSPRSPGRGPGPPNCEPHARASAGSTLQEGFQVSRKVAAAISRKQTSPDCKLASPNSLAATLPHSRWVPD